MVDLNEQYANENWFKCGLSMIKTLDEYCNEWMKNDNDHVKYQSCLVELQDKIKDYHEIIQQIIAINDDDLRNLYANGAITVKVIRASVSIERTAAEIDEILENSNLIVSQMMPFVSLVKMVVDMITNSLRLHLQTLKLDPEL